MVIVASVFPVLLLTVFLALYIVREQSLSRETFIASKYLQEKVFFIENFSKIAQSDAQFIANMPDCKDFFEAMYGGDAETAKVFSEELDILFVNLCEDRRFYDQIRVLDRTGKECIRVNKTAGDGAVPVSSEEMQDKSGRYYFQEAIQLSSGECYISPLDLNREDGLLERPLKPTVRIAAPIYDEGNEEVLGVVVVNILFKNILDDALKYAGENVRKEFHFVADADGYYLYNSLYPNKEWGSPRDLSNGEGMKKDFPDVLQAVLADNPESETDVLKSGEFRFFCRVAKMFPSHERKVIVGLVVPESVMLADTYRAAGIFALTSGVLFCLAGLTAWAFSRRISRPLERLSWNVRRLREGDTSARVQEISGNDEIARLARGFNEMAGEIERSRLTLEMQVEERTRQLDEARKAALSLMQDARQEIIERKKVEKTVRTLSRATEQSPVAVLVTDSEGKIEYVNPQFCRVTGYTAEEAMGETPRILKSGKERDIVYQDLWRTILAGQDWHGEILNKKKSGALYWANISISPIRAEMGKITHFVALQEDITSQKEAAQELTKAKKTAEAASQAKSDFLANMSHEIRTPMNAIMGMVHLALKTDLTAKQENYLLQTERAAKNLLHVINDILDFSKIEAGKLEMESISFDLHLVVDHVMTMLGGAAIEKDLEMLLNRAANVPVGLIGDPLRLGQILMNLTQNAIKFTEKGEIILSVETVEENDETVKLQFAVKDSGVGLTDEQKNRLFHAFEQADTSTTRKYGGTGLGLTICLRLVEMMNGKIWVENNPGASGCTFFFTAVFKKDAAVSRSTPYVPDPDLRGMKILLVDDHSSVREIVGKMLAAMSFQVVAAKSGLEALEICESAADEFFQLILLDWKLPDLDGLQVASKIHDFCQEKKECPKIIMFTGHQEIEFTIRHIDWLDGFIMKPFTCSGLFDAIMLAFGRRNQPRQTRGNEESEDKSLDRISGARILLVEDNEINQDVARELLEQVGMSVTIAGNGEQAVSAVKTGSYDLVLMDVQMPGMDGYEATQQIRKWETERPDGERIPIIAMTAHAMESDRKKSLQVGMDGHIVKPIDPEILYKTLQKWLSDGRASAPVPHAEHETAEELLPLRGINGLDVDVALYYLAGSTSLYFPLLKKFTENRKNFTDEMRKAIAEKNWEKAGRDLHSVKSLLGNIGAVHLQKEAEKLEQTFDVDHYDNDLVETFLQEFDKLFTSLQSVLAAISPESLSPPAGGSMEELNHLLKRLEEPLRTAQPVASQELADELKAKKWPVSCRRNIDRLIKAISRYQFEPALDIVNELLTEKSQKGKG
jgi:PAS domain S-box-containing protein